MPLPYCTTTIVSAQQNCSKIISVDEYTVTEGIGVCVVGREGGGVNLRHRIENLDLKCHSNGTF